MYVRYIDLSVILNASTKYSDYKERARRIINGGIGNRSNYLLKIPYHGSIIMNQLYNRREKIYSEIYSILDPKKCINKTAAEFYSLFSRGSTGYHTDDEHLKNMYEKITEDINIKYLDKLDTEQAQKLCYLIHKTIRYNKIQLSNYKEILKDEEVYFEDYKDKKENFLIKEFEKVIDNSKYKSDIIILSKSIVDGMKSNMDFEIVIANENFLLNDNLRKINTGIKRVYKIYNKNIIVPINKIYGPKENKISIFTEK